MEKDDGSSSWIEQLPYYDLPQQSSTTVHDPSTSEDLMPATAGSSTPVPMGADTTQVVRRITPSSEERDFELQELRRQLGEAQQREAYFVREAQHREAYLIQQVKHKMQEVYLLREAQQREAYFVREAQKREAYWMNEACKRTEALERSEKTIRELRQQVQELQQVIFSKDLSGPSTVARRRGSRSLHSDSADSQFSSLVQLVEQVCRHLGDVNENNNSIEMDPRSILDTINALQLWNGVLSFQVVTRSITKSVRLSWSNDLQTCHLPFSAIEAVDSLPCPEALLARSKHTHSTTTTTTTSVASSSSS